MSVDVGLHDGQRTCFGTNGLPIRIIYLWRVPNKNSIYPRVSGDNQICMAEPYHFTWGRSPAKLFRHDATVPEKMANHILSLCLELFYGLLETTKLHLGTSKKKVATRGSPLMVFITPGGVPMKRKEPGFYTKKKGWYFCLSGFYGRKSLATYP